MSVATAAPKTDDARVALDRVALALVGRAAPVHLEVTRELHREAVFRLRWLAAMEHGWVSEGDHPGLEHDRDDDQARYVVAWDGDELVATARIVEPGADGLLPLERTFGIRVGDGRAVQLDRLTIAAARRGDSEHRLVLAVLGRAWLDVSASGAELILGAVSPRLLALYRELGIVVTPVGRSRMYWSEQRQAILVDLAGTAARLAERLTSPHVP